MRPAFVVLLATSALTLSLLGYAKQPPEKTEAAISVVPSQSTVREQLQRITHATTNLHTVEKDTPNSLLFVSINQRPATSLRASIATLLSDRERLFTWSHSGTVTSRREFVLSGRKLSKDDQKNNWVKEQIEQISQLRKLASLSDSEIEEAQEEFPDETGLLRASDLRARAQLLGAIPDAVLDRALRGNTVDIPVSELPDAWKGVAARAAGESVLTETDPQGNSRIVFQGSRFAHEGTIRLYTSQASNGQKTLCLGLFIGNPRVMEFLPVAPTPHLPELAEARRRANDVKAEKKARDLSKDGIAGKVTIRRTLHLKDGEIHLGAYLREFSLQTKLTVLATWPDTKLFRQRLPVSIVARPPGEAIETLARAYDCEWEYQDKIIRFRPARKESFSAAGNPIKPRIAP